MTDVSSRITDLKPTFPLVEYWPEKLILKIDIRSEQRLVCWLRI